ncbi:NUDIX hydrolase [Alcanivorax sp. DP30]|uniref:NUDIX hydrolase n=1 Tax=Alcanivorax sp. DP30 TaxID=2606217 RepID=UPI00136B7390|nr:NUDIX hydrolase [Alcanivorax sp. DP30]MZR63278.1 NUDIX domain-containing protein [Alcanivorax sp. DP30]
MNLRRLLIATLLLLSAFAAMADCPRVPGEEDDRRANAGCLIVEDGRVLLLTHRWGGKLGVPGGTLEEGELAQCTAWRETAEETGLPVTVGGRLAVMSNGFHLYRCHLQQPVDTSEPVPVPRSGRTEVSAIGWYPLSSLSKDRWRFYYQFDQFVALAEQVMRSATAATASDASDGQPEK